MLSTKQVPQHAAYTQCGIVKAAAAAALATTAATPAVISLRSSWLEGSERREQSRGKRGARVRERMGERESDNLSALIKQCKVTNGKC